MTQPAFCIMLLMFFFRMLQILCHLEDIFNRKEYFSELFKYITYMSLICYTNNNLTVAQLEIWQHYPSNMAAVLVIEE